MSKQTGMQQRLVGVLGSALQDYFLHWDRFSLQYVEDLFAESISDPLPVAKLIVLPVVPALSIYLCPFAAPDEGWRNQLMALLLSPIQVFFIINVFPQFLSQTVGLQWSRRVGMHLMVWNVSASACVAGILLLITVLLDIYPLPLPTFMGVATVTFLTPFLWWCVPVSLRRDRQYRKRICYALVPIMTIMVAFGLGFPILNSSICHASPSAQVVFIIVFLAAKIIFEYMGKTLSTKLGADHMPCFVFLLTYAYFFNVSIVIAGRIHWAAILELWAFDIVEVAYHIWVLHRMNLLSPQVDAQQSRQQAYILAALLIRELIEITLPLQLLGEVSILASLQPRFNNLACALTGKELLHIQLNLVVEVFLELVLSIATYAVLRVNGLTPLWTARGLISKHLIAFMTIAACAHMYFLGLQHSHAGMGQNFDFRWMSENMTWQCGLIWDSKS